MYLDECGRGLGKQEFQPKRASRDERQMQKQTFSWFEEQQSARIHWLADVCKWRHILGNKETFTAIKSTSFMGSLCFILCAWFYRHRVNVLECLDQSAGKNICKGVRTDCRVCHHIRLRKHLRTNYCQQFPNQKGTLLHPALRLWTLIVPLWLVR